MSTASLITLNDTIKQSLNNSCMVQFSAILSMRTHTLSLQFFLLYRTCKGDVIFIFFPSKRHSAYYLTLFFHKGADEDFTVYTVQGRHYILEGIRVEGI